MLAASTRLLLLYSSLCDKKKKTKRKTRSRRATRANLVRLENFSCAFSLVSSTEDPPSRGRKTGGVAASASQAFRSDKKTILAKWMRAPLRCAHFLEAPSAALHSECTAHPVSTSQCCAASLAGLRTSRPQYEALVVRRRRVALDSGAADSAPRRDSGCLAARR